MSEAELINTLRSKFPSASEEAPTGAIIIPAQDIVAAVQLLKKEHGFDYLMNLTAIDYTDKFAVAYNIYSFKTGKKISLKVYLAKAAPSAPSVSHIMPAANWHEREAYDLMGIDFTAHPDLRRILLSDSWVGHPLRKDYVKDGFVPMPRI